MDIEIRPIEPGEFDELMRISSLAFGHQPIKEEIKAERLVFEIDRSLAAFDGAAMAGETMVASFQLTVPGAILPAAGVTSVAVAPTHRRRGVMTAMTRRQLDDTRERGEPLAALYASEAAIYGRFGYGLASYKAELEIERAHTAFAGEYEPRSIRVISKTEALAAYPAVFESVRPHRPGFHDRNEAWWKYNFQELERDREGFNRYLYTLSEGPEGPDGYVVYRTKQDWSQGYANGTADVVEMVTANTHAYAALWRYCFDLDLMTRTTAWLRPVDEPLIHMLTDPRRLRFKVEDGLWVRLVDVPTALAGRHYSSAGRVVLEVRDSFCPWNEGRYELVGGPDGSECRSTDKEPDLELTAADLAAVYLGGVRFAALRQAGRLIENKTGAIRRADAMCTWDPAPWCPDMF
ncbi:MAG TPA: GNAT family N-acetyltransferase [Actinomycetota bacterium]|nr:GNAT family N-acetyltransferase [Actinomycetota bacterium]